MSDRVIDQLSIDFVAAYADWLGVSFGEAYQLLKDEPLVEITEDVTAAGWDESKHPRHPAGSEHGGEFAPAEGGEGEERHTAEFIGAVGSDRDPGWDGDPVTPGSTTFGGNTYNAVDHSDQVWNHEQVPDMNYHFLPYYSQQDHGREYRQRVAEEFARIGAEGELRVQTPAGDVLEDIFLEERFKSQFETASSGGVFSPEARAAQEEMFFGYPQDIPPHARPIYGWLEHPDRLDYGQLNQYGTVSWRIKDSVKARTTMTSVDSLSRPIVPGPVRNPGWRATLPPGYTDGGLPDHITDLLTDTGFFDDLIETQYHGGLTLDDVEGVDLRVYDDSTPDEQYQRELPNLRALQRRGIPVRFFNSWGDEIEFDLEEPEDE